MRRFHIETGARSLRMRIPASSRIPESDTLSSPPENLIGTTLERWLAADSLRAFCVRAHAEFHQVFGASRLLIVSWLGVRQCSWALHPADERVTRIVDDVFSHPGTGISSLIVGAHQSAGAPTPETLTDDPRLTDAGFNTFAVIETDSDVNYHVFWDDHLTPAHSTGVVTSVSAEQLWHVLKIALGYMARLERLRELSHIDFTTGIFNRRYFELRLTEEVSRARRFERPLSLAVLDIDDFKSLNDTYGHQAGDAILHRVAECVRWTIRSIDVFCRLGGDEFTVLMPDADLAENPHMGDRLRNVLARRRRTIEGVPEDLLVTVSIGGAVFPTHCDDEARLIWCADMALLEAKHKGRDRFVLYEEAMGRSGEPGDTKPQ